MAWPWFNRLSHVPTTSEMRDAVPTVAPRKNITAASR
jgi:hypothetical protein